MTMVSNLIVDQAAQAEKERLDRIAKAWDAYHGNLANALKVKPGQDDDNVKVNFSRLIVDKGVSFLFGDKVDFEVDGEAESEQGDWLDECWEANKLMTTLHELGTNGGVCGHAYIKLKSAGPGEDFPRVIIPDPATVFPTLDPEDYKRVLDWRIEWNAIDPVTGKPMVRRQLIQPSGQYWEIVDQVSRADNTNFEEIGRDRWPFVWAPIMGCQNLPLPNVYWGLSDLESDLVAVNKAINFVLSNINRIIRFHAHPKTWGKGFQADQIKIAIDETLVLGSPNAELKNLEMLTDLGSSLEFYKLLKEVLHEMARVPEIATGKVDDIGALSGVALKILYQSLIEKTATKRVACYGDLLREANKRLLELGGQGDKHKIKIHWAEPLPKDTKEEAETGLLLDQLGISLDTIQTQLGFDAEDEADKKSKEKTDNATLESALMKKFDQGQTGGGGFPQ